MRNLIFDIISDFGECFLLGFQFVARFLVSILTNAANGFIEVTANIFKMALWLVDEQRVNHAEHVIDQASISNELEILMRVSKLKEDALERSMWTNYHSLALNDLSSKLYNECDWEKERIHHYMREIVESIPGLSYVAADEDDDDPIELGD